jgi:hypothetical protein
MHRSGRAQLALLVLGAVMCARRASPAEAPTDEKEACFRAVDDGQKLRANRKLIAARDAFIQCARSVCPALVRKDCAQWLSEVQVTLPSIVFGARDAQGKDLFDVHVSVDGNLLTDKLDGTSVAVDPGQHVFRFEWEGHGAVEQPALIREGEKSRLLTVSFPVSTRSARPIPVGVWIFGALGLVGGGGFAAFALWGQSDVNNLRTTCAPACSASDVDSARTKVILANVSLGVGIASLGVATTWFIVSRSSGGSTTALSVEPALGGGRASFVFSY